MIGVSDAYTLPSAPGHGLLKADTARAHPVPHHLRLRRLPRRRRGRRRAAGRAHRRAPVPGRAAADPAATSPPRPPAPRRPPPEDDPTQPTMLSVMVDQIAARGGVAHQVWLPPLDDPAPLDVLLGGLAERPGRGFGAAPDTPAAAGLDRARGPAVPAAPRPADDRRVRCGRPRRHRRAAALRQVDHAAHPDRRARAAAHPGRGAVLLPGLLRRAAGDGRPAAHRRRRRAAGPGRGAPPGRRGRDRAGGPGTAVPPARRRLDGRLPAAARRRPGRRRPVRRRLPGRRRLGGAARRVRGAGGEDHRDGRPLADLRRAHRAGHQPLDGHAAGHARHPRHQDRAADRRRDRLRGGPQAGRRGARPARPRDRAAQGAPPGRRARGWTAGTAPTGWPRASPTWSPGSPTPGTGRPRRGCGCCPGWSSSTSCARRRRPTAPGSWSSAWRGTGWAPCARPARRTRAAADRRPGDRQDRDPARDRPPGRRDQHRPRGQDRAGRLPARHARRVRRPVAAGLRRVRRADRRRGRRAGHRLPAAAARAGRHPAAAAQPQLVAGPGHPPDRRRLRAGRRRAATRCCRCCRSWPRPATSGCTCTWPAGPVAPRGR